MLQSTHYIMTEQKLVRAGDILSLRLQSRGHTFSISSEGFYPSSANLKLFGQLQGIQTFFHVYRKGTRFQGQDSGREPISYEDIILLKHYLSQKLLCVRASESGAMQLYLRESLAAECEFKLLPLFRCQIINSRRVRQDEEILLASAFLEQGVENYLLSVQEPALLRELRGVKEPKQQQNASFNSDFFMSKATHNSLMISCKGEIEDNSQLLTRRLYRMKNVQLGRWLSFEQWGIAFNNSPSEFDSFLYLVLPDHCNSLNQVLQSQTIYVRSQKYEQYLQATGETIQLAPKLTKNCEFRLVEFRNASLTKLKCDYVYFLQHIATGRNISAEFNQKSNEVECKLSTGHNLKDTVQFVPVADQAMNRMFFLNQVRGFLELYTSKEQIKQKAEQFQLLEQLNRLAQDMIVSVFSVAKEDLEGLLQKFFGLSEMPVPKQEDQNNFLHCRITHSIIRIIGRLTNELKTSLAQSPQGKKNKQGKPLKDTQGKQRKDLQSKTIQYLFVLLSGLCIRNLPNTAFLISNMHCIYDNLAANIGALESFIQIFRGNREFLKLLENQKVDNRPYVYVFISKLREIKRGNISLAINITELLRSLVLITNNETLRINQAIIGEEFPALQKALLLDFKSTADSELMVKPWREQQPIEVQDMYIRKGKYTQDLMLVQQQLGLYGSLCLGRNYVNIRMFRKKISLELIVRYMNKHIDGEFKSIMLSLFVTMYLDVSPRKVHLRESIICLTNSREGARNRGDDSDYRGGEITNRLLAKTNEIQMMEGQNFESDSNMEDIKGLLLKETDLQISQARFSQAFYMYIEVLGKFISFGMLTPSEKNEFKKSLQKFLVLKQDVAGDYRQSIYAGVLTILLHFELDDQQERLRSFVQMIKDRSKLQNVQRTLEQAVGREQSAIIQQEDELLGRLFDKAVTLDNYEFLDRLIVLLQRRKQPRANLLKSLRSVIILQDSESIALYSNLKKNLIPELDRRCQNFNLAVIKIESSEIQEAVRKLSTTLQEVNMCFFAGQSTVDMRHQHLILELGVHIAVISFLTQNFKQLQTAKKQRQSRDLDKAFIGAFRFLSLFILHGNSTNCQIIQRCFPELCPYLELEDFGQKRFFLELARIQQIKPAIQQKLVNTLLQNPDDSIYVVSILIEYTRKLSMPNRRFIDELCKRLLTEEKCFEDLLRVKRTASGFELPVSNKTTPGQLVFYTEALKLVNILCEYGTEKKYFHSLCRKYLPLDLLLRALQINTIFDQRKNTAIFGTLLSRELLQTISLLYLQDIRLPPQGLELLLAYVQKAQKMISCYGEHGESEKAILLSEFIENTMVDCHEIMRLVEGLEVGQDAKNTQFLDNFDWMGYLLTKVSPIIGQLLHLAMNSESAEELVKKQADMLRDSYETILQDMIYDMLTKEVFEKNQLEYLRGLDKCGEAFGMKFKLGFQVKQEESRPERLDDDDDTGDILVDRRLKSIVDSHQRSSSASQSAIYKGIFQIMHNQKLRQVVLTENTREQERIRLSLSISDRRKKVLGIMARSYIDKLQKNTIEKGQQRKFFMCMVKLLCELLQQGEAQVITVLSETRIIECSVRYLAKNTYPDMSVVKKIVDFTISMLGVQGANKEIQDQFERALQQVENSSQLFRVMRVPIEEEKLTYSKAVFNEEFISKKSSSEVLVYELDWSRMDVETSLKFFAALVKGDNKGFKEVLGRQNGILEELLDLLRVYIKFILGFTKSNRPYYPYIIDSNLCACLGAIGEYTNYQANISVLADKNFSESINILLSLNDSLKQLQESQNRSPLNYTESLISECPSEDGRKYLKGVYFLSVNSERFYKDLGGVKNPFLPVIPNYLKVKTKVLKILLELINLQDQAMFQAVFKGVSEQTLRRNILEIYEKNLYLFSKDYDVFSFDINAQADMCALTPLGCDLKDKVKSSFRLENGFSLLFVLLRIEVSQNRSTLEEQRLEIRKVKARQSIVEVFSFFKDLWKVIVRICTCCFTNRIIVEQYIRSKSEVEGLKLALDFFLLNSGHVQIMSNQSSHSVYFPLLPECARNINIERNYLKSVDLSSPQTKGQSLVAWSNKFVMLHQNQDIYKRKYKSFPFIELLMRHIELFKNISFVLIAILNVIILLNSNSQKQNGLDPQFSVYDRIMIVQLIISYLLLIFFSLKEMPLVMLETTRTLERRKLQYGSNFASYPYILQRLIWLMRVVLYPQFLYHLLYTVFVSVAYFVRIFAAILLLDIFIRIPLLRRVLMSIWRPKLQILLTILAYVLVEYYFSILLYFVFDSNTYGMCNDLQSCFSFVFYVTYKVVGGFPGYIFQYKNNGESSFSISAFAVFEDIYVIVIFQIFFAVLSGIIIDNFSIIRAEEQQKLSNLKSYCLVCGGNSSTINQTKSTFSWHIALNHNIWDYFSYITYLNKKTLSSRTQLEQHVLRSIDRKSIEWLPLVGLTVKSQ